MAKVRIKLGSFTEEKIDAELKQIKNLKVTGHIKIPSKVWKEIWRHNSIMQRCAKHKTDDGGKFGFMAYQSLKVI